MSGDFRDRSLRASLLDRLVATGESDRGRYGRQSLSDLVRSVHEHLELLLNTRWRAAPFDDSLAEIRRSLVQYGIPDFASTSAASRSGREEFARRIRDAILLHEPRFISDSVRVAILEVDDTSRSIEFRIEGTLHAKPYPLPVVFHSEVNPDDQRIRVRSSEHV